MKAKPILLEIHGSIEDIQGSIIMRNNKLFTSAMLNSALAHKKISSDRVFEIYLIDEDAEIKEGDWCYNNKIGLGNYFVDAENNTHDIICTKGITYPFSTPKYIFKVICCTDKFLGWTNIGSCEKGRIIGNKVNGSNGCLFRSLLPQLSEQSIILLIDYYNKNSKMPDEVKVRDHLDGCIWNIQSKEFLNKPLELKLNSEGTVDITIPEEKMYNKEEVINLFISYCSSHRKNSKHKLDKWIKENL